MRYMAAFFMIKPAGAACHKTVGNYSLLANRQYHDYPL